MSGPADLTDIRFLSPKAIERLHDQEIESRGGQPGIRDRNLLLSAVAQPRMQFSGEFLHKNVFEMAAAYAFHLVGNHPFVDGNKRVALTAALIFLWTNGWQVRERETALADIVLEMIEKHRSKIWLAKKLRSVAVRV